MARINKYLFCFIVLIHLLGCINSKSVSTEGEQWPIKFFQVKYASFQEPDKWIKYDLFERVEIRKMQFIGNKGNKDYYYLLRFSMIHKPTGQTYIGTGNFGESCGGVLMAYPYQGSFKIGTVKKFPFSSCTDTASVALNGIIVGTKRSFDLNELRLEIKDSLGNRVVVY